ncbi:MAG: hypothetical protein EOP55_15630, partial [Sphingobacteriales bacterium]
ATRASIIETLITREYITREKRNLLPTFRKYLHQQSIIHW